MEKVELHKMYPTFQNPTFQTYRNITNMFKQRKVPNKNFKTSH